MKFAASTLFALALAACASAPESAAPAADPDAALPDNSVDTCGANLFAELIGKPVDGPGVPGDSRLVRHIRPNSSVTMDYIAQRMNIEIDAQGVIRKINCG